MQTNTLKYLFFPVAISVQYTISIVQSQIEIGRSFSNILMLSTNIGVNEMSKTTIPYTTNEMMEYKKELQKYYLACLWMEGSKIILFTIIFGYMNLMSEYFMALFMLMLLRTNGGGIHCKHYFTCFMVSLLVLFGSIFIPQYIQIPIICTAPLLLLCAFLGYQLVPILSESRPEPTEKLIKRCKRRTFFIILFYCFIICFCPANIYLNIGAWTIFIHILQLLFAKFRKGGFSHEYFHR